jgi:hypothetical protein
MKPISEMGTGDNPNDFLLGNIIFQCGDPAGKVLSVCSGQYLHWGLPNGDITQGAITSELGNRAERELGLSGMPYYHHDMVDTRILN